MNKTILISIIVVILLVAVGGYFIYYANSGPAYQTITPSQTNTAPTANTAAKENPQQNKPASLTTSITIENFAFNPNGLTVKEGATVVWINQDLAPHKIKSDTFNSAVMNKGESFQFIFSKAGEYDYFCSIHPSMKGKITVIK